MRTWAAVLWMCAPALAMAADFEGTIEMKMTGKAAGTSVIHVGKGGMRTEMSMDAGGRPMKVALLIKSANPDIAYMLDDGTKTWREMNLKAAREQMQAAGGASPQYTAKKLGTEKVAGHSCTK